MSLKRMKYALILPTVVLAAGILFWKTPQSKASNGETFKLDRATVRLDVPTGWESVEGMFGTPLMIGGPYDDDNETRPVVTVVPSGVDALLPAEAGLAQFNSGYREERESWVNAGGGKVLSISGFKYETWPTVDDVMCSTDRYLTDEEDTNDEVIEKVCHVSCKGEFYHVTALLRAHEVEKSQATLNQILKSFACE